MTLRSLTLSTTFAIAALTGACTSDSTTAAVPAAPSALTATLLSGGAHLTWTDNSSNETQFMIMRMQVGGTADYAAIATPTFNTVSYHDIPPTAGKTYMYMVMAMNDSGMSDPSNEVMIAIP